MKTIIFKPKTYLQLLLIAFITISCSSKSIKVATLADGIVAQKAESELSHYLPKIYDNVDVEECADFKSADITMLYADQLSDVGLAEVKLSEKEESYKILSKDGKLYLIANEERGLLYATYALLEELGCGFYLSKETTPVPTEWSGFGQIDIEDSPVVSKRFLFNWHNFISGCTGWNLEDWKAWIDGASKMKYNGVMIHSYGNNPMFSFDYMGETKTTGYVNNSASGRDWGNQHINDVRNLIGGELFDAAVYGAAPSFADESHRVDEATSLIQDVFSYCDSCSMDISFAIDLDTWMSNPQNIIAKMPKESVFDIRGYLTPNPDCEEGYKYYKNLLKTFIETYPQVDELTAWSRTPSTKFFPGLGTIWMAFAYEDFPRSWKKEFDAISKKHPEVKNNLLSNGLFAFSKIVKALQRAAKELNSDIVIGYGSWGIEWLPTMDIYVPKNVPFRPLDASIIFDSKKCDPYITPVAENREVYPIVWAHHDDFSYLGRPYAPYENLTDIINKRHVNGLGIIHWTTHPLDLYFKGTGMQLWEKSANIEYKKVVDRFVVDQYGSLSPELSQYFNEWAVNGPMFGRETSDHIVDLGKLHWKCSIRDWNVPIEPTKKRIEMMDKAPKELKNDYWKYQRNVEEFYLSFFENQAIFDKAYNLLQEGDVEEAREILKGVDPEKTVAKYVETLKYVPITAGERALVISLNSRWMVDYFNIKQRVGLQEVLTMFAPTQHDPLAQMPGVNTYDVDKNGNWWSIYWEKELPNNKFVLKGDKGALCGLNSVRFPVTTMHKDLLSKGEYTITLETNNVSIIKCSIIEDGKVTTSKELENGSQHKLNFSSNGSVIEVELSADGEIELYSYRVKMID